MDNVNETTRTFHSNITGGNDTAPNSTLAGNITLLTSNEYINHVDLYITKVVLNFTILPILILIGLFGNISTIIVFFRGKQKTASVVFVIGLAFSDLLILILRFIANVYSIGHEFFTEAIRNVKPNSFIWIHASQNPQRTGNLFILAIVVERCTAVWHPLKQRQVWTTRKIRIICIIIVILTLGDMITFVDAFVFSVNERIPDKGIISTPIEAGRYIRQQSELVGMWSSVYRFTFDLLPLPVVFTFNVLIIIGIRRKLPSSLELCTRTQRRKYKEQKTTRMLLVVSMLFIVLCSPFAIYVNLVIFGVIGVGDVPFAVYQFLEKLYVLNSVVNFIVYGVNDRALREKYLKLYGCQKGTTSKGK